MESVPDLRRRLLRAIPYVQDNAVKQNLPRQTWPFLTPYAPRFDSIDPLGLSIEHSYPS